jgi:hypothetical protein
MILKINILAATKGSENIGKKKFHFGLEDEPSWQGLKTESARLQNVRIHR